MSLFGENKVLQKGKEWPKISIISSTRDHHDRFSEHARSIKEQNYPYLEHVLLFMGENEDISSRYASHLKDHTHLIAPSYYGYWRALDKAMQCITGEIIMLLDVDDQLLPGALNSIALAFASSGADLVAGLSQLCSDTQTSNKLHLTSCPSDKLELEAFLGVTSNWSVDHLFLRSELAFTKEIWTRAGGFIDGSLHYSAEHDLWIRFAAIGAKLQVIGRLLSRRQNRSFRRKVETFEQKAEDTATVQYLAETPVEIKRYFCPCLP
ncbi:MAG: glycosyltransferase [Syntrophobacteraceae bacterium]